MSTTVIPHPSVDLIKQDLAEIELDVLSNFTLADAIREGSKHTNQLHYTFVHDNGLCALSAAYMSAQARGYMEEAS